MVKTTIKLEYILQTANNFEFDNTDVYISRKIFEHFNCIPGYSLEKMLSILNVSRQCFKKYLHQLDFKSYTEFKDEITFDLIVRMSQIKTRYQHFEREKLFSAINSLTYKPLHIDILNDICEKIHAANRVVIYGSPTLLNLFFDFQVDMRVFDKVVITSSVNSNKIIVPEKNDLIGICTSTGRLFGSCDAQFQDLILNADNYKILFTKDDVKMKKVNIVLSMDTTNDYYEMHYVFLFYLDLIKTRYYELYIKEN